MQPVKCIHVSISQRIKSSSSFITPHKPKQNVSSLAFLGSLSPLTINHDLRPLWFQHRKVAVDHCTNTLCSYSVQTLRLINVKNPEPFLKREPAEWHILPIERWQRGNTDPAQICRLKYSPPSSSSLTHKRHMETRWCFDNKPSVIFRAWTRLLPSIFGFLFPLPVSSHVFTHIFSQVIQITVLNGSRLTFFFLPQALALQRGFSHTTSQVWTFTYSLHKIRNTRLIIFFLLPPRPDLWPALSSHVIFRVI